MKRIVKIMPPMSYERLNSSTKDLEILLNECFRDKWEIIPHPPTLRIEFINHKKKITRTIRLETIRLCSLDIRMKFEKVFNKKERNLDEDVAYAQYQLSQTDNDPNFTIVCLNPSAVFTI